MFDLAKKYVFCLSSDIRQAQKAFLLLYLLEQYINGAILQTTRINNTRKIIGRKTQNTVDLIQKGEIPVRFNRQFFFIKLHCDYHFYFVCIGQVAKNLKRLYEILNDQDLQNVYLNFEKQFDKDIRDHLEHIDERAIGKKFKQDIGHITDFGNFLGDSFSFNGKKYPVNQQKTNELKKIYEDIIAILYKNYASKDDFFLRQEQSEKQSKLFSKQFKKLYDINNI